MKNPLVRLSTLALLILSSTCVDVLSIDSADAQPTAAIANNSSSEVDAELKVLREGMVSAFKKRDFETLLTFVTSDIIVTWQNGEVTKGKDELRAYNERMLVGPTSVVSEVDGDPEIQGRKFFDDHVISVGNMRDSFTLRATGEKLPLNSRFSALVVKENGRYLLSGLHLSVNAFDNPILAGAVGIYKSLAWGVGLVGLLVGFLVGRRSRKKAV